MRDTIFFSYSHANGKWLTALQKTLKPALKNRSIKSWADTDIKPGAKWRTELEHALNSARVAVLLVSTDFLASDFIVNNELPPLLEAAEHDGLIILWVYVGACMYTHTAIADYQAAHDVSKPLKMLTAAKREMVLVGIADRIIQEYDGVATAGGLFVTRNVEDLPQAVER